MRIRENVIINYWLPYWSKLGNLGSFYCVHQASKFDLGGVSISNFTLLTCGGKIVTKNFSCGIPNSHAKKYGMSTYFSSLANTTTLKYYIKNAQEIFKIGKNIKFELENGKWINMDLKIKIFEIISNIQKDIARETFNLKVPNDENEGIKLIKKWAHKLILHVYVVEELSKKRNSKTPGLDGITLKGSSTSKEKIKIVKQLKNWKFMKSQPVKRVWIPKNKTEKRPLIIPNMIDRAIQLIWLILLDPIIENNSDPHSFGFRKGRNVAQAIGHIQKNLQFLNSDSMYFWDVDTKYCFFSIDHSWILRNTPIPSEWKKKLVAWLKSESVILSRNGRNSRFEAYYSRAFQGGILSSLLMNIVLNGMQELMLNTLITISKKSKNIIIRKRKTRITIGAKYFETGDDGKTKYRDKNISFFYCRYADAFVIGCASRHILKEIQKEIIKFLFLRGLVVSKLKSKTIQFKEKISFDFLGYTFIRLKYSPYRRVKFLQSTTQEYRLKGRARLYIHPSKNSFKEICRKFKYIIRCNYNTTAFQLINKINPLIQGWCNYFCLCNSTGTRDSLRFRMWLHLKKWAIRKHPKAGRRWLMKQYFLISDIHINHELSPLAIKAINNKIKWHKLDKWTFYGLAFKDYKGQRYKIPKVNWVHFPSKKVKTIVASIFVPSTLLLNANYYLNKQEWQAERDKYSRIRIDDNLWEKLYRRDKGICYFCNKHLEDEQSDLTEIEIHHKIPWAHTQNYNPSNLVLAHRECHKAYHSIKPVKATFRKIVFSNNRVELLKD